jgi:two-component system chemotaxis sensor kinase CheA
LISLHKHIQASPRPELDRLYAVVFKVGGNEAGLIVPNLLDIREVTAKIDDVTFREPGVMGSLVVDDKATRLVDVFELAEAAYPNWFTERKPSPASETDESPRILLVEDSDFFRKQVGGFFENHGYRVVGCEDGVVAWEALCSGEHSFDLVVTDIEMPNMDGFELSRRIKQDPRFDGLPIIALTSLAGEDDVRRGREVGIDDYQVKMDREQLLSSVQRLFERQPPRPRTDVDSDMHLTGA